MGRGYANFGRGLSCETLSQVGEIMKKIVCFYHSTDLDGHCSGAIVRKALPQAHLVGVNYGDGVPWDLINKDTLVVIVDFSFPMADMHRIQAEAKGLVWIDHHKSAIEAAGKEYFYSSGIRRIGDAGCELAWEYFFNIGTMPRAVRLLGRYDVWDHQDLEVLPFQMGLRLYDTSPECDKTWEPLLQGTYPVDAIGRILGEGYTILRYQDKQNEMYAKSCAFETELGGLRCIAVNRRLTNSKIFDSVYDPERHDAMLVFGWQKGEWCCSLYTGNRPDVDVSKVAKGFGGGGHAGAAGFSCSVLPFALK